MELILAKNLQALMAAARCGLDTQTKISKATKRKQIGAGRSIDQRTVGRILKAEHRVQIDTLQALAAAFELETYQLLIPGLDPKNPQILRALSPEEENLYRALELARKGPAHSQ